MTSIRTTLLTTTLAVAVSACGTAPSATGSRPVDTTTLQSAETKPPVVDSTIDPAKTDPPVPPTLSPDELAKELAAKEADRRAHEPVTFAPPQFSPPGIYTGEIDAPISSTVFLPTSEAIVYTDTNVYEVYAGTPGRDHEKDGTVLVLIYSRANPLDTKSILIPAPKQGQGALTATEIRDTTIDLTQAGTTEHLILDLMTLTIAPGTQS